MVMVYFFNIYMFPLWFQFIGVNPFFLPLLSPRMTMYKDPAERWRTDDHHQWTGTCTDGQSQSPVDLVLGEAELVDYGSMKFHNYHLMGPVFVERDGHSGTVEGFFKWDSPPSISGGDLRRPYYLRQLHFHWDSEHTFNGLHYSAELHLVHISDAYDPTLNTSLSGKIAVVAIPFQVGDSEAALEGIEDLLLAINSTESHGPISFSPGVLLPTDTNTFFRYSGSLTTPPCTEGVTWTILSEPVLLSPEQFAALKGAGAGGNLGEVHNARPIQLMKGRKLYLNKAAKSFLQKRTLTEVFVILGLMLMMMIAPPLLIIFFIYEKSALPHTNSTTTTSEDLRTEAARAEPEIPREEPSAPGTSQQHRIDSANGQHRSRGRRIYEFFCISKEEPILPYHGE